MKADRDGKIANNSTCTGVSLTTSTANLGIYTIRMNNGGNVFNPDFVRALSATIDTFIQKDHPKSLIITGSGKFFSNGFDLKFFERSDEIERGRLIELFWRKILARILIMDCRTVAVINGHG